LTLTGVYKVMVNGSTLDCVDGDPKSKLAGIFMSDQKQAGKSCPMVRISTQKICYPVTNFAKVCDADRGGNNSSKLQFD